MIKQDAIEDILNTFIDTKKGNVFGKEYVTYSVIVNDKEEPFIVYKDGKEPLRISLRCEYQLLKNLSEKYESAMPSSILSKNKWIDIILTGQIELEQIKDLIVLSRRIALGEKISS